METITTSILVIFALVMSQKAGAQQLHADKAKHFVVGGAIADGTGLLTYKLTNNKNTAMIVGFGAGVVVGVAKEIYDLRTGNGYFEVADAVWTGIGSAVGTLSFSFVIPQHKPRSTVAHH